MLGFNSGDHRWYLLTPSFDTVKAVPVISDEFGFVANTVVSVGDTGSSIN